MLIWLKDFQFGENELANLGLSFFYLAKILAKESKTLAQALHGLVDLWEFPSLAATIDGEVSPSFNPVRFDLNQDCCLKLLTNSDYFSHSIWTAK